MSSQHPAPASTLISAAVKEAGERAKAEEKDVADDDSMILSDSGPLEYTQPYNKCPLPPPPASASSPAGHKLTRDMSLTPAVCLAGMVFGAASSRGRRT
jgi:hypothetical protein